MNVKLLAHFPPSSPFLFFSVWEFIAAFWSEEKKPPSSTPFYSKWKLRREMLVFIPLAAPVSLFPVKKTWKLLLPEAKNGGKCVKKPDEIKWKLDELCLGSQQVLHTLNFQKKGNHIRIYFLRGGGGAGISCCHPFRFNSTLFSFPISDKVELLLHDVMYYQETDVSDHVPGNTPLPLPSPCRYCVSRHVRSFSPKGINGLGYPKTDMRGKWWGAIFAQRNPKKPGSWLSTFW